jgi:hypothetical protein
VSARRIVPAAVVYPNPALDAVLNRVLDPLKPPES